MTIWDLKQLIHDQAIDLAEGTEAPVPTEPQRQLLRRRGVPIDADHKTLAYYGIDAGTTIHL